MVSYDDLEQQRSQRQQFISLSYAGMATSHREPFAEAPHRIAEGTQLPAQSGVPTLTLYNPTLDIRMVGVNGAIIGRRQGPYHQLFESNMYISGVHAQLIYKPDTGWCIIDKHSSNGTKLNQREVQPDVPMSLKSGDIVTLANINLQVSIN
jgi:pSer/pThr/pTyr-binding forkhead associated (FHA) protein